MRLFELLSESLHDVLDILKNDAEQLANGEREHIGIIELTDDWEEEIPRLAHRFEKEMRSTYNSFIDPHGDDEIAWITAHYNLTMEFLIKHGLARKIG